MGGVLRNEEVRPSEMRDDIEDASSSCRLLIDLNPRGGYDVVTGFSIGGAIGCGSSQTGESSSDVATKYPEGLLLIGGPCKSVFVRLGTRAVYAEPRGVGTSEPDIDRVG